MWFNKDFLYQFHQYLRYQTGGWAVEKEYIRNLLYFYNNQRAGKGQLIQALSSTTAYQKSINEGSFNIEPTIIIIIFVYSEQIVHESQISTIAEVHNPFWAKGRTVLLLVHLRAEDKIMIWTLES